MMVEQSPLVGKFLEDLNRATNKIKELQKKPSQAISSKELDDLITHLKSFNTTLAKPSFLEEKKIAAEEMDEGIKKALDAIKIFQENQPEKNKAAHKNVSQAIISLFSALTAELNMLDTHLKNLKDHKIGRKVEGTHKSKQY